MNYTPYHVHTMWSNGTTNIDSVTSYEDYIDKAAELGMTAFAFSEHGNIFEWLHKKEYTESKGLKYIHAVEAYLTESIACKARDNYHCVLIAKNYEGFKELNKIVSNSFNRTDGHFYYEPRISFEELFNTSNNIIITTACLGGVLNRGSASAKDSFISFLKEHKDRCYLEIQHHNCEEQIKYNQMLYTLSKETGIPLIAGTDSHSLNGIHNKGRSLLQKSKDVEFSSENEFDLQFKSYDELISAYELQNSLPMDVVREAIENTNIMADMIEPFSIDKSPKYPKLYADSEAVFKQKINEGFISRGINKFPNAKEYVDRVHYEFDTYKHNGAIDFMLLEEDYKRAMREKGVRYGYSRGSVSGSLIAYLLHITEVDSLKYNLNFERFMNTERISLADVDTDWYSEDRGEVREYLYNKEGLYCCDIITFNTIALKGAIDDVCRGLYKHGDNDKEYLRIAKEIKNLAEEDEAKARQKYQEVFEYVDILNGVITSVGNHPAGCVVSPFPVDEFFGTCSTKGDKYPVSMLNMKEIDSLNFVKLDILGLDNVGLIYKTCDAIGIPYITPGDIDSEDKKVWDSIKDDTTLIFQMESDFAHSLLKDLFSDSTIAKIKKKNPSFSYIDLFSMCNGAIRPAGDSYRVALSHGEYKDNGCGVLNNFLKSTLGYLVYQCQVIEFLHKFCGYTMGEADTVRRCIDEHSLITMSDGTKKEIKDIKEGDEVVVLNDDGSFTSSSVNKVYDNGIQNTYEIKTTNHYAIKATGSHKVLTQRGWVKVEDLTSNDYLMAPKMSDCIPVRITSIENAGKSHVYDLEINIVHNYIANGLVVHNCFSKKLGTEKHIPQIKEGFCKTMLEKYDMPREQSEKIVQDFLQVIMDASDYLFSKNHSDPYSWIGYVCGWLRYYYPLEFLTTALNIWSTDQKKSSEIVAYAKKVGIKIAPIKFRYSSSDYAFDKSTNTIYKGIASIKFLNGQVADELLKLKDNTYNNFAELLGDISGLEINSKQLKILIELGFFDEFGDANKLLRINEIFEASHGESLTPKILNNIRLDYDKCRDFIISSSRTSIKVDAVRMLSAIEIDYTPRNLKEDVTAQIEYLGYVDIADSKYDKMLAVLEIDKGPRIVKCKVHALKNGNELEVKIPKKLYTDEIEKADIIKVLAQEMKPKSKMMPDGTWGTSNEREVHILKYVKI